MDNSGINLHSQAMQLLFRVLAALQPSFCRFDRGPSLCRSVCFGHKSFSVAGDPLCKCPEYRLDSSDNTTIGVWRPQRLSRC